MKSGNDLVLRVAAALHSGYLEELLPRGDNLVEQLPSDWGGR